MTVHDFQWRQLDAFQLQHCPGKTNRALQAEGACDAWNPGTKGLKHKTQKEKGNSPKKIQSTCNCYHQMCTRCLCVCVYLSGGGGRGEGEGEGEGEGRGWRGGGGGGRGGKNGSLTQLLEKFLLLSLLSFFTRSDGLCIIEEVWSTLIIVFTISTATTRHILTEHTITHNYSY